jgi:DNA-binding transcriptional LysR family regulator
MDVVDMQEMRWFRSVADGTTVTGTAASARVTQPALSRALARIEHEVGTALFQRVGRVLRLTPAGQVFKTHVDAILERYDRGLHEVGALVDPEAGTIPLALREVRRQVRDLRHRSLKVADRHREVADWSAPGLRSARWRYRHSRVRPDR